MRLATVSFSFVLLTSSSTRPARSKLFLPSWLRWEGTLVCCGVVVLCICATEHEAKILPCREAWIKDILFRV